MRGVGVSFFFFLRLNYCSCQAAFFIGKSGLPKCAQTVDGLSQLQSGRAGSGCTAFFVLP